MNAMEQQAVLDRVVDRTHAVILVGPRETEMVVPVGQLPFGTRPGDWLVIVTDDQGTRSIRADPEATKAARQRVAGKMAQLRQRGRRLGP